MNPIKRQARYAGALYLLVALTAPIGLIVVPGRLFDFSDAAATVAHLVGQEGWARLGMASEIFHQVVEVFMVLALYDLFRPVNASLARQMAVLGLLPIPIVFLNVLNEVAALLVAHGAGPLAALGQAQGGALALLFLHLHASGLQLAAVFWGLWLLPLGRLMSTCGFMPRAIGWLVVGAGCGYIAGSITALIVPSLQDALSLPVLVLELGEPVMILWLAIVGARVPKAAAPVVARTVAADGR